MIDLEEACKGKPHYYPLKLEQLLPLDLQSGHLRVKPWKYCQTFWAFSCHFPGFPCGSDGKESACNVGDVGLEDPLEKGMATHSSTLAWRIPWMEEPGGLQFMGSQRSDVTERTEHAITFIQRGESLSLVLTLGRWWYSRSCELLGKDN